MKDIIYANTHTHTLFIGKPLLSKEHCNSCQKKLLMSSRLLWWLLKEGLHSQLNCLFYLGVDVLGDVVEARYQRIWEFDERMLHKHAYMCYSSSIVRELNQGIFNVIREVLVMQFLKPFIEWLYGIFFVESVS